MKIVAPIIVLFAAFACLGCGEVSKELRTGMSLEEAKQIVAAHCPNSYGFAVANPETGETGVMYVPLLDKDTCISLYPSEKDATVLGKIVLRHGIGQPVGTHTYEEVDHIKLP